MKTDKKMVLKSAQNMIDRYGDDVLTEIDLRIAELESRGQRDAQELWKEIRKAAEVQMGASTDKTRH
jgi:gas vesicle protein